MKWIMSFNSTAQIFSQYQLIILWCDKREKFQFIRIKKSIVLFECLNKSLYKPFHVFHKLFIFIHRVSTFSYGFIDNIKYHEKLIPIENFWNA